MTTTDFRRADPTYVNFTPKTCADAIDLFQRHRRLGLQPSLYPEVFVHCARALPDKELDNFHLWIVQPAGDLTHGTTKASALVDMHLEKERRQLLKEAQLRDSVATLTIEEEKCPLQPMSEDDEKEPITEPMDIPTEPMEEEYLVLSHAQ